MGYKQQTDV